MAIVRIAQNQMPICGILVLTAKGKFMNRPTQTGGKKYDKFYIYVPTDLVKDSQFPFKSGDEIDMKVDAKQKRLVISAVSS